AFTGSDPAPSSGGVHFECSLDSAVFASCSSPKSYGSLVDGSHTFKVRAIDAVGNTDATPATYTWSVDTVAPDTSITNHPSDPSASSSASFAFTGSDPAPSSGGLHFECSLDSASFTACSGPKNYGSLTDGSHTFQVRAIDAAGNADASPASFTWFVDTTPPDTSITSHPANPSSSSSATFAFTGSDPAPSSGGLHFECSL